jgi:hypothetical protein
VLLEKSLASLWRRAHVTLGETALSAIVDRVLTNGSKRFPFLDVVKSGDARSRRAWEELRARADSIDREDWIRSIRFVLVELLTVIDGLTGGILTPALQLELKKTTGAKVRRKEPAGRKRRTR